MLDCLRHRCIRCGREAKRILVYRGWPLCHNPTTSSCYDVAATVLAHVEQNNSDVDMTALQQCLEECWALLQVHAPTYLHGTPDLKRTP